MIQIETETLVGLTGFVDLNSNLNLWNALVPLYVSVKPGWCCISDRINYTLKGNTSTWLLFVPCRFRTVRGVCRVFLAASLRFIFRSLTRWDGKYEPLVSQEQEQRVVLKTQGLITHVSRMLFTVNEGCAVAESLMSFTFKDTFGRNTALRHQATRV